MTTPAVVAAPTDPPPPPPPSRRPLAVPLVGAVAGLALIVTASSSPVAIVEMLGIGRSDGFNASAIALSALPAVAVTAGLLLWRRWPWLLGVAALLSLPLHVLLMNQPSGHVPEWGYVSILGFNGASGPLAVVGVLCAAQELHRRARPGLAALVGGGAVGAQVLGQVLIGTIGLAAEPWAAVRLVVTLVAFAAVTVAAGFAQQTGLAPGERIPLRAVTAGGVAALLALVPTVLIASMAADPDFMDALTGHPSVELGITGVVIAAAAIVLALAAGTWAVVGVAAVGLVLVGTAQPLLLAVVATAFHGFHGWVGAAVGMVVALPLAWSRWRVPAAAALAVISAIALPLLGAPHGQPGGLAETFSDTPSVVLIALFVATAVAVAAAAVPANAHRGVLPAVLGPLVATFALGGSHALVLLQRDGETAIEAFVGVARRPVASITLLLLAAAATASIGVGEWVRHRQAKGAGDQ